MRKLQALVNLLWRWHRRLGVLAAFFLVLLAASGMLIGHAGRLGLDRAAVAGSWLRAHYGDVPQPWRSVALGNVRISRASAPTLYLDARAIGACEGSLQGALALDGLILVACEREVQVLGPDGALVESLGAGGGLAVPVLGIGLHAGTAWLRLGDGWRRFDADAMSLAAPDASVQPQAVVPDALPPALAGVLVDRSAWLTWERVLLDVHSGRFFGPIGVLVVDLAALCSMFLALSGASIWWLRARRHRRHAQPAVAES